MRIGKTMVEVDRKTRARLNTLRYKVQDAADSGLVSTDELIVRMLDQMEPQVGLLALMPLVLDEEATPSETG